MLRKVSSLIDCSALIIDDDPVIRLMMTHQLQGEGVKVAEAISGIDVTSNHNADDYDVIICDIEMPGMSGLEVYETWAKTSSTPFILVTGYLEEAEVELSGVYAYLTSRNY